MGAALKDLEERLTEEARQRLTTARGEWHGSFAEYKRLEADSRRLARTAGRGGEGMNDLSSTDAIQKRLWCTPTMTRDKAAAENVRLARQMQDVQAEAFELANWDERIDQCSIDLAKEQLRQMIRLGESYTLGVFNIALHVMESDWYALKRGDGQILIHRLMLRIDRLEAVLQMIADIYDDNTTWTSAQVEEMADAAKAVLRQTEEGKA